MTRLSLILTLYLSALACGQTTQPFRFPPAPLPVLTTGPSTKPATQPVPQLPSWVYPSPSEDGRVHITEGEAFWLDATPFADPQAVIDGKLKVWGDGGNGSSAYNVVPGFVYGHRPNHTGRFRATLNLADGINASERPVSVVVEPDTRPTVYVDPDAGNDSSDGGQQHPLRSIARAMAGNVQRHILLAGSKRHGIHGSLFLRSRTLLAIYGTGRAEIYNDSTAPTIRVQADGCVIRGIDFTSAGNANAPGNGDGGCPTAVLIDGAGGTVVEDCGGKNLGNFIETLASAHHTLAVGCVLAGDASLRSYALYDGGGTDLVWLGGSIGNSTRQHCMRFHGAGITVYGAVLSNLGLSAEDQSKPTISFTSNACYGWVESCTLAQGPIRVGPQEPGKSLSRWTVLRHNTLDGCGLDIAPGTVGLSFTENTVTRRNWYGVNLDPSPDASARATHGINITNNEFHNTGTSGVMVQAYGYPFGVSIHGNTYIAPNVPMSHVAFDIPSGPDVSAYDNRLLVGIPLATQPTTRPN